MNKSTHFIGQPLYVQLLNYFNRDKILSLSQAQGGEHYIKKFDAWHHLVVMLYAVMLRLDSLREIKASLFANVNRFNTRVRDKKRLLKVGNLVKNSYLYR